MSLVHEADEFEVLVRDIRGSYLPLLCLFNFISIGFSHAYPFCWLGVSLLGKAKSLREVEKFGLVVKIGDEDKVIYEWYVGPPYIS